MMRRLACALLALLLAAQAQAGVRIKDIVYAAGEHDSQIIGYGLVVGLQGTGDTLRNVPFTEQSLQSMLEKMGMDVRAVALRNRNVASVIVTADLAVGLRTGRRLDVTVSAMGDATSLMGGTLLMTQMSGADGRAYASAQGAVSVTGFEAAGQGQTLSQGVPTAGRIANGAIIQHEVPAPLDELRLTLELRNPDDATAIRAIDAINAYARARFHRVCAFATDSGSIELFRPAGITQTRFMAEIGALIIQPDTAARVVIDARTGTVVIGQDVQISPVAVTHGALTVRVSETPHVSQPAPLSGGRTVTTPDTKIDATQSGGQVAIVAGSSLRALVNGLNRIGEKPDGIMAILQAIKSAGALQADLVAQ